MPSFNLTNPFAGASVKDPSEVKDFDKDEDIGAHDVMLKEADKVAQIVMTNYFEAAMWRQTARLGDVSYQELLNRAYDQYYAIDDEALREIAEEYGFGSYTSLTEQKVDVAVAILRDLFFTSDNIAPFLTEPTPISQLSGSLKEQLIGLVFKAVSGNLSGITDFPEPPQSDGNAPMNPAEQQAWFQQVYQWGLNRAREIAKTRSDNMNRLIDDQLVEGNFRRELSDFLTNFALYPLAVMYGPITEARAFFKWKGDSLAKDIQEIPVFRSVNPEDYFFSPDTFAAGEGTYDIIRENVSLEYLKRCMDCEGFIKENVQWCIENYSYLERNLWLLPLSFSSVADNNQNLNNSMALYVGRNLLGGLILRYFGRFSGKTLAAYGIEGLPHDQFYECEVMTMGYKTLRLIVHQEPVLRRRPVYASSWQKTPGNIYGIGMAQLLRDYDRAYQANFRFMMANAALLAGVRGEVDASRIAQYAEEYEDYFPSNNEFIPVAPDPMRAGGQTSAFQAIQIPNNIQGYLMIKNDILQQVDSVSGITAGMVGQPVGTGVNRTAQGFMQLQANAMKKLQSSCWNLDRDVFDNMGDAMFAFNMLYSDNENVKADCKTRARGTFGLLQRDLAKQNASDTLKTLIGMGPALAQLQAMPGVPAIPLSIVASQGVRQSIMDLTGISGADYDAAFAKQLSQVTQAQQAQEQAQAQSQPQQETGTDDGQTQLQIAQMKEQGEDMRQDKALASKEKIAQMNLAAKHAPQMGGE